MSLDRYEEINNDDYEENIYDKASHYQNDNVLFLIDARSSMLEPVPPTKSDVLPGGGCIKHEVNYPSCKPLLDNTP